MVSPSMTPFRFLAKTSSFRLALLGALALASAAAADTVALSGTVASTAAVTSTSTAGASSLDLATATEKIVKAAGVALSTNNTTGLTVTVTSGNLTKAGGQDIPYKVTTVAAAAAAPLTGAFTVASGTNYTYSTASDSDPTDVTRDLYIAYTPAAKQDPGAYSGTITLTVLDN
jgi:hypothetical protein